MGNKTRNTGNLVSDTNIFVDISNDRVGIGSTLPTAKLDVAGIVSATSFYGDGTNLTGLTNVAAATYGNGTAVPQITVDANGRISSISNVLISGGGGGGSSVIIQDSQSVVGTAGTIDFGTGLTVSPVVAGIVTVTGITTANVKSDTVTVYDTVYLQSPNGNINASASSGNLNWGSGNFYFNGNTGVREIGWLYGDGTLRALSASGNISIKGGNSSENMGVFKVGGAAELYYNNSKKFETTNTGSIVTGILTATSFSKSGGTSSEYLMADGSVSVGAGSTNLVATWTVISSGLNYQFLDGGIGGSSAIAPGNNPTLYLVRGQVYKFENRSGGHPFRIQYQYQDTSGTAYTDGIRISDGGAASSGADNNEDLYWEVKNDAPDLLHYQCTSHSGMSGRIVILGDSVVTFANTSAAGTAKNFDVITGIADNAVKMVEYTLHIEHSTGIQAQKFLVMQNGTTAYSQEYGIMHSNGLLVSLSATISGGNLLLQATPETGINGTTTYTFTRKTIR